jgi:hypothetical protein
MFFIILEEPNEPIANYGKHFEAQVEAAESGVDSNLSDDS